VKQLTHLTIHVQICPSQRSLADARCASVRPCDQSCRLQARTEAVPPPATASEQAKSRLRQKRNALVASPYTTDLRRPQCHLLMYVVIGFDASPRLRQLPRNQQYTRAECKRVQRNSHKAAAGEDKSEADAEPGRQTPTGDSKADGMHRLSPKPPKALPQSSRAATEHGEGLPATSHAVTKLAAAPSWYEGVARGAAAPPAAEMRGA